MATVGKMVAEATGLSEEIAKRKLLKLIPETKYQERRNYWDGVGLGDVCGDNTRTFIGDCLCPDHSHNVDILIKLLKEE